MSGGKPQGSGGPAGAPASGTWFVTAPTPAAPTEGERYAPGAELGRGGMGRVQVAWDAHLEREVAQKVALPAGPDAEARLRVEAQIAAQLEHPGVVPVYDLDRGPEGQLRLTSRLVRGPTLAAQLDRARGAERLGLLPALVQACAAVAFAHRRGIVHRDLKPANILIGPEGEAMVADWGLARAAGPGAAPGLTAPGQVVGTPAYMAPEQAAGAGPDPRQDVWALGQILAALLEGDAAAPAALRAVADRARAPRPADRYADAGALLAELQAWQDGRRVAAHRYSPVELVGRALRSWPVPLGAGVLAALLILCAALVAGARTRAAAVEAERARAAAVAAHAEADSLLAESLAQQARVAARAGARAEAEVLAAHALRLRPNPVARGALLRFAGEQRPRLELDAPLDGGCRLAAVGPGGLIACADAEGVAVRAQADGPPGWRQPIRARSLCFLGPHLVILDDRGEVSLFSAGGARLGARALDPSLLTLTPGPDGAGVLARNARTIVALRWTGAALEEQARWTSPVNILADLLTLDGRHLSLGVDGALWSGPVGEAPRVLRALGPELAGRGGAPAVAISADGQSLVYGTHDGHGVLVDLMGGGAPVSLPLGLGPLHAVALSPDGRWAAWAGASGRARVLDRRSGALAPALPAMDARALGFVGEGALLVLGGRAQRWALPMATPWVRAQTGAGVAAVRLSPSGLRVASFGSDGRVQVRSRADGALLGSADLSPGEVLKDGLWHGEDALFVPALRAGQPSLLDAVGLGPRRALPPAELQRRVVRFGGGQVLGFGWGPGPVAQALDTGEVDEALRVFDGQPIDLAASAPTDAALLLTERGGLWLLRPGPPAARTGWGAAEGALAVDVHEGGAWGAVVGPGWLQRWGPEGARGAGVELGPRSTPADLALSPDGRWAAVGLLDGRLLLVDLDVGTVAASIDAHGERVASVDWAPDSRHLATGSWDGEVAVWALAPLDAAPEALVAEVEAAWGMDLRGALRVAAVGP